MTPDQIQSFIKDKCKGLMPNVNLNLKKGINYYGEQINAGYNPEYNYIMLSRRLLELDDYIIEESLCHELGHAYHRYLVGCDRFISFMYDLNKNNNHLMEYLADDLAVNLFGVPYSRYILSRRITCTLSEDIDLFECSYTHPTRHDRIKRIQYFQMQEMFSRCCPNVQLIP